MGDTIAHRGPDGHGEVLTPYNNTYLLGLAHRRLSIVDLSKLGHQPMSSPDKNVFIIFNGEIYNFPSLRKELKDKGHTFKSETDTEVLLHAYLEWGIACLEKLEGMFAFALYDARSNDFYLVRDRMGVKPLYYYKDEDGMVFGSELKPIMMHPGFKKSLNKHALSLFLYHGYITAPHTIFENTYKLEPGTYLHFKNGKISQKTYWSLKEKFKNRVIKNQSEEAWVEELDKLLTTSVKSRMVSDVPIGCFLSGGIDSSLITALMQKESSTPIKTFTIGFNEAKFNEAPYAKEVARHLGTDHHEEYLSVKEAQALIPDIPTYYDEPFADSSQLPTMLLCRTAKKHVTVALSGDGGDELFCGYGRYDDIIRLKKYEKYSKLGKKAPFLKSLIKTVSSNSKVTQFFELHNENSIINSGYLNYLNNFRIIRGHNPSLEAKYWDILSLTNNFQEKHMLQDLITYLPDDILTKVDRASMGCSLEARVPFVDSHQTVGGSFDIPHHLKYKNGNKKYILKKILDRYVPQSLIDRPKMGFGVPVYTWIRNELKILVEDLLSDALIKDQNIFDLEQVRKLKRLLFCSKSSLVSRLIPELKNDGFIERTVWHILVFQLWYDAYFTNENIK